MIFNEWKDKAAASANLVLQRLQAHHLYSRLGVSCSSGLLHLLCLLDEGYCGLFVNYNMSDPSQTPQKTHFTFKFTLYVCQYIK